MAQANRKESKFPFEELNAALAPAANARRLRESDLMDRVKEARRHIWEERYRPAVEKAQAAREEKREG
ncbi:MAG: hypothetical protein HY327_01080 [Chloroflexi bacterium]|nr:hypothetical protein [Chloroflexota bacterium]